MICSLKREVQDPVPAAMAELVEAALEAEASVEVAVATVSSQREENLTKYKR